MTSRVGFGRVHVAGCPPHVLAPSTPLHHLCCRFYLVWRCIKDRVLSSLPKRHTVATFSHTNLSSAFAFKVHVPVPHIPARARSISSCQATPRLQVVLNGPWAMTFLALLWGWSICLLASVPRPPFVRKILQSPTVLGRSGVARLTTPLAQVLVPSDGGHVLPEAPREPCMRRPARARVGTRERRGAL